MRFVVGSGGEEQRVRPTGCHRAEGNRPQAVHGQRPVIGRLEVTVRLPTAPAEGVDPAVAEVSDQQLTAELAEGARCLYKVRRGSERIAPRDATLERSLEL